MAIAYTEISRNKTKSWALLLVFMIFVGAAGFVIAEIQSPGAGSAGLILAGAIAIIWALVSYYAGDKMTLASTKAKPIKRSDNQELYRVVENLSITAGLPTPKIYVIQSAAMNAFATGRDPNHSSVAVTTGLLEKLDKKELEGVIAHELSHIGNYDIRLMMIVVALFGVIMLMNRYWLYGGMRGGGRRRGGGGGKLQLILLLLGLLLVILGPIFAMMIRMAISRKREFLADASGALLTRYPEGLASALEKISGDHQQLQFATQGTAHLFIANPFKAKSFSKLFSTHPPVEERVKALRDMGV